MVIESMKLETAIKAWREGAVAAVHVGVGQAFQRGAPLLIACASIGGLRHAADREHDRYCLRRV